MPTQQMIGMGEVLGSQRPSKPREGGEVGESQDSLAPCEGGEIGECQDSLAPCEGGEFRRRPRLKAPKTVEEKLSTKAHSDQAADCRQSSGRFKMGEMSPKHIKSVLDTAMRMFSPDELLPRDAFKELAKEFIASADGNYGM